MDLMDIFYSTATEELFTDCVLILLFSESLGVVQALHYFAYDSGTCPAHSESCVSSPQPDGTCLTSSAICSSCPRLTEASPRPISVLDTLLFVLLSFITGSGFFTLSVEPLCACDNSRVWNTGEEDPLA